MSINKIPLTLEVLEHLRTHMENIGTDFCNFDIEVSKTFSGKTAVKFIDTDNGAVIEQHFLSDDDDVQEQDIDLRILLRRRNFPF
ncbi:MAG: hypothetical protein K9L17_01715 [Clostridiales bacterium]|nr:hypothetical protein [Clostridiales bacterium]MCF8021404.1 hypothetical protein [Clostridiales bacterium]